MEDLYDALASLFDSLNALSFRIPASSDHGTWIARVNFKIGSVQEDVGGVSDPERATARAHRFAGQASTLDPSDRGAVERLLEAIDAFLDSL